MTDGAQGSVSPVGDGHGRLSGVLLDNLPSGRALTQSDILAACKISGFRLLYVQEI
jgi:hypothetical protein